MNDTYYALLQESDEQLNDTSAIIENLKESGASDQATLIKNSSFLNMLQIENEDKIQDDVL